MILYADLLRKKACSAPDGSPWTFPEFLAGDSVEHSVRFLNFVEGRFVEADLPVAALRASIGAKDARPESGSFRLKVGPAVQSPENTTAPIPWDATAAAVQAALNAVPDGPHDFAVDFAEGTYTVRRHSGELFTMGVTDNSLAPIAAVRMNAIEADAGFHLTLRPTQVPVIFTDSTRLTLPDPPAITTVQDGGADPSGVVMWNEIQAIRIPPEFRGTYQLRRGLAKTVMLDPLDGPDEIKTALDTILRYEGGTVRVTNPTSDVAHIEFQGGLAGSNLEPLEVVVTSSAPPDLTWTLDFSTRRVRELMDLYEAITVPYEVEADIYRVHGNPAAGTYTIKLWSQDVTIRRPLIWPGLSTVQEIDWLRPPNAVSYHPFDYSQVLTGSQQAVTAGITSGKVHAIAHNLGTAAVQILVREAHPGGRLLHPDEYVVTFPSLNEAGITLEEEPTTPLVAHLIGIGPASAFQSHTHGIHQITQLQDILDQLGERVSRLEALVGRPDMLTVVQSGNKQAQFRLPDIGEILPDRATIGTETTVTSQVTVNKDTQIVGGSELDERKRAEEAEQARVAAEQAAVRKAQEEAAKKLAEEIAARTTLEQASIITRITFPAYAATYPAQRGTRLPMLLPALKGATVTNTSSHPATPSIGVYRNSGAAAIELPAANGRKTQTVAAQDYFAWDGRVFYRVIRRGDHYYPLEMERVLWRAVFREELLPAGSMATAAFDLAFELKAGEPDAPRLDVGAQYLVIFDCVPVTDLSGEPNIGAAESPLIVGEYRLPLSAAKTTNRFGVKLTRTADGSTSQTTGLNRTVAGPSLPTDFALRCRLSCFDVDDTSADPRGTLTVSMPGVVLTVEKT